MMRYWKFRTGYWPTRPPRDSKIRRNIAAWRASSAALARQSKPQVPLGLGKVAQVAGRALEAVDLLVHLPMKKLDLAQWVPVRKVGALDPALRHREAGVAGGAGREQRGVETPMRPASHRATPSDMIR